MIRKVFLFRAGKLRQLKNTGLGSKTPKYKNALTFLLHQMYIVHMTDLSFEWDETKSKTNKSKHGVSFEEAQTVFFDEHAMRFLDPDHSEQEERFILLGISFKLRVLVVCHCYRKSDTVIRIISARKAIKTESNSYRR